MTGSPPPVPFITYEAMRQQADAFLRQHWPERNVPIDIEKIADVRLGLDIVEVEGLKLATVNGIKRFMSTRTLRRLKSGSNFSRHFQETCMHATSIRLTAMPVFCSSLERPFRPALIARSRMQRRTTMR